MAVLTVKSDSELPRNFKVSKFEKQTKEQVEKKQTKRLLWINKSPQLLFSSSLKRL